MIITAQIVLITVGVIKNFNAIFGLACSYSFRRNRLLEKTTSRRHPFRKSGNPLDGCAKPGKLFFNGLIAPVEMIYALYFRLALGHKACQDQ